MDHPDIAVQRKRVPRLLPKDDKVLEAIADCRRQLESAADLLNEFEREWFNEGEPNREAARAVGTRLVNRAHSMRNAANNLLYLTDPGPR